MSGSLQNVSNVRSSSSSNLIELSVAFCVAFAGVHSAVAYQELTGKIELFNKFLCFAITLTLAILYMSVLPYTFFRYYILNMGEDSFELFYPPWFVFYHDDLKTKAEGEIPFSPTLSKVPVQLENTIRICGSMAGPMCRSSISGQHLYSVFKSSHWIMLVFHLHRWRHYSGFGRIQQHC